MLSQEAQEGGSFSAEAPANLNPEYDEPRPSGALELWVGLAPFASGCVLHAAAGRVSAPARAEPVRVTGLTIVASIASWAPCHGGKPLATTSMRRASLTGTSMFMSQTRTFRATCAPASRQTRATACSSGRAREAKKPEVAQAERWSPSWSRRPWQEHVHGAQGKEQQAPEQQHAEVRRRHNGRGRRERCEGTGRMGSCLQEQQRSRRGVELRKMRLESALVASGSRGALPST